MKRALAIAVAILAVAASVVLFLRAKPVARQVVTAPESNRVVSLAPALTETLFAIGAWDNVVGVSDYCDYPAEAKNRPHLGTSLTPNYEAIARINPTLIVSEGNAAAKKRELDALARTELLPWLSLDEIVQSTRKLGALVGRGAEANALADRLQQRLGVPEPASGPRVLIVIGYQAGKLDEVWFIRRNSLHGAMLRAAGGKNAVAEDVPGLPRMSLTRLIELDPDVIVILPPPTLTGAEHDKLVADWKALGLLRAVKAQHIVVFDAPDALTNGPRILELTDRLAEILKELGAR